MKEVKMYLTPKQWKKLIMEMLDKDEVVVNFESEDTRVVFVKVSGLTADEAKHE